MKNVALIAVLVGTLGGVAGTFLVKLIQPSPETDVVDSRTSISPADHELNAELEQRIAQLQAENDSLAIRLASLEARTNSSREEVAVESTQDLAALQQQVMDLAAALKNPQSAQAAGLRNMVAVAMEEVRDLESEERRVEREQRDIDRIVTRMDDYSEKLGLDEIQRKSMQAALIDSTTKRTELFSSMRDGTLQREEIRSSMTALTDESNARMSNILTPAQFDTYTEMEDRGRSWFGGNDRGGRGNRSGRGGD